MASLNDNLFTTLLASQSVLNGTAALHTACGEMQVVFAAQTIRELSFQHSRGATAVDDPAFQTAFINWIKGFQQVTPSQQWGCLKPSGSRFQQTVWRALLDVPLGQRLTYRHIAEQIGKPQAARAVGGAIGANPLAILIPCHRIVPSGGGIGHYRWGVERKRVLLDAERRHGCDLAHLFESRWLKTRSN